MFGISGREILWRDSSKLLRSWDSSVNHIIHHHQPLSQFSTDRDCCAASTGGNPPSCATAGLRFVLMPRGLRWACNLYVTLLRWWQKLSMVELNKEKKLFKRTLLSSATNTCTSQTWSCLRQGISLGGYNSGINRKAGQSASSGEIAEVAWCKRPFMRFQIGSVKTRAQDVVPISEEATAAAVNLLFFWP